MLENPVAWQSGTLLSIIDDDADAEAVPSRLTDRRPIMP
jgi:hypothetical protein